MKYLEGQKIKLVKFTEKSITPKYMSWLNNAEVTRFLDTGRFPISTDEVFAPKDEKNFMFMIMTNFYANGADIMQDNDFINYIGTCSLHKIDWISRKCEIGYMIGDKEYWGRGIASEVVGLLTHYAFDRLNLNKITAGVVEGNMASVKALEKNGFKQFTTLEQDYYLEGQYLGTHRFNNFQEWYRGSSK